MRKKKTIPMILIIDLKNKNPQTIFRIIIQILSPKTFPTDFLGKIFIGVRGSGLICESHYLFTIKIRFFNAVFYLMNKPQPKIKPFPRMQIKKPIISFLKEMEANKDCLCVSSKSLNFALNFALIFQHFKQLKLTFHGNI